jgi:excisionase family DNA binding protein
VIASLSGDTINVSLQQHQSDFLTDREVALRTGVTPRVVRELMKQGRMPGMKMGRSWMVPRPLWEQYLNGEWERVA